MYHEYTGVLLEYKERHIELVLEMLGFKAEPRDYMTVRELRRV